MIFWIKNAIFILAIVIVVHVLLANNAFKQGLKAQLINVGLVDRVPNDSPLGLDITKSSNTSYLAKLKKQTPLPLSAANLPTMLPISSGTVYMGCLGSDAQCAEEVKNYTPVMGGSSDAVLEKVDVAAFQIAETETTLAQWDACVAHGGCQHMPDNYGWGRGDLPVLNVSWVDVQDYLAWLNSVTDGGYRLPSNAEWEYAAKAGTSTRFPWGDGLPECDKVRHGSPNWMPTSTHRCQIVGTWPVKSKQANPWGLYHVIGNAAEWVAECGRRAAGCDEHLNRGGNWVTEPETSVLHTRDYSTDHRYNRVGFRLARSVQ